MTLTILATVAAALGLYLVIRPALKALPQLKAFYMEAESIEQKVWAVCWRSSTVAVSYGGTAAGFAVSNLDRAAAIVGDEQMKAGVQHAFGAYPQAVGIVLMVFSAIVFAARMRSIVKSVGG
jgi:hypothetical protein